jgi:DNA-binding winged helix-turn-helix (wHTH) protein
MHAIAQRSLGDPHETDDLSTRTAPREYIVKFEYVDMTTPVFHILDCEKRPTADVSLEFGRFRVLLRQRLLIADGVQIELGGRAFELLLALLQADGALVTKAELLARVWPGIIVTQANVKTQVFALRKALAEGRDFIRTEFGRGYRFTAAVRSTVA